MKTENEIATEILDVAFDIHRQLGPGLLESVYKEALYLKLQKSGLAVTKEKPLPVFYDGIRLDLGYRLDLEVDKKVIVEVKAVESIAPIHEAQILTYLKIGEYKLGLLINFNTVLLKNGIRRFANGL